MKDRRLKIEDHNWRLKNINGDRRLKTEDERK